MSAATETMNYYEGMFLIHSGRFASDSEGITKELMEILEKCEAEVVAHRPWTEGKLAYEIEKPTQRPALSWSCSACPPPTITQLNRLCQLSDNHLASPDHQTSTIAVRRQRRMRFHNQRQPPACDSDREVADSAEEQQRRRGIEPPSG